jgi:hypothetical protein
MNIVKVKKKMIKKKDIKVGKWVRTQWDDVGAQDGIVVDNDLGLPFSTVKVFFIGDNSFTTVNCDQITAIGNYVAAKDTGLP